MRAARAIVVTAVSLALMVAAGFAGITASVSANTLLQLRTPDELRGRIMSLYVMLLRLVRRSVMGPTEWRELEMAVAMLPAVPRRLDRWMRTQRRSLPRLRSRRVEDMPCGSGPLEQAFEEINRSSIEAPWAKEGLSWINDSGHRRPSASSRSTTSSIRGSRTLMKLRVNSS